MIWPECCPACGQPVAAWEWLHCVVVDRAGTRAHLACLETPVGPGREASCGYMLAPRLCNPGLLRPGARFVALAGDAAVVEVPTEELAAQERALGGQRKWFFTRNEALRAAQDATEHTAPEIADLGKATQETVQQIQKVHNIVMAASPASLPAIPTAPLAPPSHLRLAGNRVSGTNPLALVTVTWDPSPDARTFGYVLEVADSVQGIRALPIPPGALSWSFSVPRGLWFAATLWAQGPGGPSPGISLQGIAAS